MQGGGIKRLPFGGKYDRVDSLKQKKGHKNYGEYKQ